MATTTLTKIVLERDGEEKIAYAVTKEELEAARADFVAMGLDVDRCDCGHEACINGYVWRCAYGPSGNCQWFKSDWRCQS